MGVFAFTHDLSAAERLRHAPLQPNGENPLAKSNRANPFAVDEQTTELAAGLFGKHFLRGSAKGAECSDWNIKATCTRGEFLRLNSCD